MRHAGESLVFVWYPQSTKESRNQLRTNWCVHGEFNSIIGTNRCMCVCEFEHWRTWRTWLKARRVYE
jgi:hypothetical protein